MTVPPVAFPVEARRTVQSDRAGRHEVGGGLPAEQSPEVLEPGLVDAADGLDGFI
jgi:hypothetical protein